VTKSLVGLAVTVAVLVTPAAGQAATTFGSRLNNDPANAGECTSLPNPCTLVSFIHPTDPNGDPNSAGAPVDGVITKFRVRITGEGGAAATVTFRLASISRPDPNDQDTAVATLVADGPTVTIPANNEPETPILEFPARVTVRQGNHLALDGTNVWATYNNSGDKFSYVFSPPLVAGQGPRGSTAVTGELLVQAVIEPDADGDGFGDETQDGCPTQASNQGTCDNAGPGISGVAVRGRTINYSLSENATLTFTLQKARPGRRVRGRCRRPTRRNRKRPRCARYLTLPGSFSDAGEAGANALTLPRRLGGRRLGPGRYRLLITARDQFGNETQTTKRFVIKSARR